MSRTSEIVYSNKPRMTRKETLRSIASLHIGSADFGCRNDAFRHVGMMLIETYTTTQEKREQAKPHAA